jgi:chromosome segregation ATPase
LLNTLTSAVPKRWIILGIVFSILVGYIYLQKFRIDKMENRLETSYTEIGQLNGTIDSLRTNLKKQEESIKLIRQNFDDVSRINTELQKSIADIREDTDNVIRDYNSYKSRLRNLTLEKPTLIERRVNNATANILQDFEQSTSRSN